LVVEQNKEIGSLDDKGVFKDGNPRKAVVNIVCEYAGNKNARLVYKLTVEQDSASYNENPVEDEVADWIVQ
jgi:hypothetical protein